MNPSEGKRRKLDLDHYAVFETRHELDEESGDKRTCDEQKISNWSEVQTSDQPQSIERFNGGIVAFHNYRQNSLFGPRNQCFIYEVLPEITLPSFSDCSDWMKALLYEQYQVETDNLFLASSLPLICSHRMDFLRHGYVRYSLISLKICSRRSGQLGYL